MITGSEIYWITRLNEVRGLLLGFGIGSLVVMAIILLIRAATAESEYGGEEKRKKWEIFHQKFKKFTKISVISILLIISTIFIPTTKEMCAILVIPKIISNEQVQELPEKVVDLANEWIEELRPQKPTE